MSVETDNLSQLLFLESQWLATDAEIGMMGIWKFGVSDLSKWKKYCRNIWAFLKTKCTQESSIPSSYWASVIYGTPEIHCDPQWQTEIFFASLQATVGIGAKVVTLHLGYGMLWANPWPWGNGTHLHFQGLRLHRKVGKTMPISQSWEW